MDFNFVNWTNSKIKVLTTKTHYMVYKFEFDLVFVCK